jgi:Ca-activated chloride channel family protein
MKEAGRGILWVSLAVFVSLAAHSGISTAGPAGRVKVSADFDNAYVHVSRPGERHLEIEVTAPDGTRHGGDRRPPMNIALVIDKSGSMAEAGKLDYVKKAAMEMVGRLRYGDRFSVVVYDDDVRTIVRSEAVEDPSRARRLIKGLHPGGSTNLGAGLLEGYGQVRRHYIEGGINRVLLLSDGLANRGITSARELSRIVSDEGRRGVSLATFGVGFDFNEDLLASMAESGRGTYYYIDRPGRIGEILAGEFANLQQIVALDVTVTIEVLSGMAVDDVMGYDYRREGDGCRVSIGDLAAGEKRRIMVLLRAPTLDAGDHPVGRVKVRYQPRGERDGVSLSQELRLQYVQKQAVVDRNLNREVTVRSSVYEANDARRKAAVMVDRGDLDGAREILGESRRRLEEAPVQSDDLKDEIAETEGYQEAIDEPMSPQEKKAVQKGVKYRSYKVLQSK